MKYIELNKKDALNRLDFLAQAWKDRAEDESLDRYDRLRAEKPFAITLLTHGDLAPVVISMTKAKELIRTTWERMPREAERMTKSGQFVSAIPTMELHLTDYGTLWLSACIEREAGPELQAKWDAIQATREEQFPELYEEE